MLFARFLRRSFAYFLLVYSVLLVIIASGDILVRLATLPALAFIPSLILCMIPLISLFAIPLAAGISIFLAIGAFYEKHEWLLFKYLLSMQRMITFAVFIFSLSVSLLFIPLVFEWAPTCYWQGKQMLVHFATDHINKLSVNTFHTPINGSMLFFDGKHYFTHAQEKTAGTNFSDIVFMFQDYSNTSYLITAPEGYLIGALLTLRNGIMQRIADTTYRTHFKQASFHLDRLIESKPEASQPERARKNQMKYLTTCELYALIPDNNAAFIEFNARIVRVLWVFCLPFFAIFGLRRWGIMGSNNMVICIGIIGILFLISYISITGSFIVERFPGYACAILYGTLFLSLIFMYLLGNKKKS